MFVINEWLQAANWFAPILRFIVAGVVVVHILLVKRNSRSAVAWIAVVLVFPLVGSLVYWLLGINRMRSPAAHDDEKLALSLDADSPGAKPQNALEVVPMRRVGGYVTAQSPIAGNRVQLLENGEQAYPAMLHAIATAEKEILLMTYIFECGEVGQMFVAALLAAKQRGVIVYVLIDDVGRRHNFPTILPQLKRAELQARCFNPLRLLPPNIGLNLRNHRKMLIIDQKICFSGGMNIGQRHLITSPSNDQTSDLCFKFQGPVVASMRQLFQLDWYRSRGPELDAPQTFAQETPGDCDCRVVADGPDAELDNLTLTIVGVLSAAQRRIIVITPYFLPNSRIIGALQAAALRGVEVSVVIPARCNWPIVRWALNHGISQLLQVGVRFHEQPAPFSHSKCLLIDDDYALVGSANIDERSLRLNFELGIEILDREFCEQLERYALDCIGQAVLVTRESIEQRNTLVKLRDALASLFEPYL